VTKDLGRIERAQPDLHDRIIAKIQALADRPTLGKPLLGPLKGKWSLRIGEYRVIYEIGREVVVVLTVNHRREVYR